MAEDSMTGLDVRRKGDEGESDFLREAVRQFVHALRDEEVSALIGAERYERSADRTTQRNGTRHRPWDTRVGTSDLAMSITARSRFSRTLILLAKSATRVRAVPSAERRRVAGSWHAWDLRARHPPGQS